MTDKTKATTQNSEAIEREMLELFRKLPGNLKIVYLELLRLHIRKKIEQQEQTQRG